MTHDETILTSADTINEAIDSDELLSAGDAAVLLGYTEMGIRQLANRQHIRDVRVGHACFYLASDIAAYKAKKGIA